MRSMTKRTYRAIVLTGLLMLAIGILLTAFPTILVTVCRIAGGLLCVAAAVLIVLHFVRKNVQDNYLGQSILSLIGGVLLILLPGLFRFLVPVFFGLWLISTALSGVWRNLSLRGTHRTWWVGAILCGLCGIAGIFILTRPTQSMDDTVRLIGIVLMIASVLRLSSTVMARHYYAEEPTGDVIDVTLNKE
ncbi:MAG: DUF308 domain-containing protein [Oscillospiraceae bacterium]|nr:DUF308 domain-containing protein [Oscillospiraceae bacterium]